MDIVGLDLDSVIGNTEYVLDKYLKENHNFQVDWEQVVNYKIEEIPNLPKKVMDQTFKDMFEGNLLFDILPYNYAEHSLNKLHNEGFKIAIITSRPFSLKLMTMDCLDKYNLKYDSIYHAPSMDKYKIINAVGIKSFVEDRSDIVDSIVSKCNCIEYGLYIVDHPWNKGYEVMNLTRVTEISEAVDRIIEYRKWRDFLVYRCQGSIEKFVKEYSYGKGSM